MDCNSWSDNCNLRQHCPIISCLIYAQNSLIKIEHRCTNANEILTKTTISFQWIEWKQWPNAFHLKICIWSMIDLRLQANFVILHFKKQKKSSTYKKLIGKCPHSTITSVGIDLAKNIDYSFITLIIITIVTRKLHNFHNFLVCISS